MKKTRTLLIRLAVVVLCIAVGATMLVIGRGHTIYLDNKTLEDYNGQTYSSYQRITVIVDGEELTKLQKRERTAVPCIGQTFRVTLELTQKKGDEPVVQDIELKLPYDLDGIIINLPAYLAGLPEEAWLTEFIPAPPKDEEEEPIGDGLGGELGLGDDLGLGTEGLEG